MFSDFWISISINYFFLSLDWLSSAERRSSNHDLTYISGLNTSIGGPLLLINIKLDTFEIESDDLKFVIILFIRIKPLSPSAVEHGKW